MTYHNKGKFQNQSGFSLIEVIVSIVLLTIILISMFTMILQSTKTSVVSEDIFDATYIAQTEMENAIAASNTNTFNDRVNIIQSQLSYSPPSVINGTHIFRKSKTIDNKEIIIQLEIKQHSSLPNLTPIIIKVYEVENSVENLIAQLENILTWR